MFMLTLYYSPGACSMASHIALEETGEPYEAKETLLSKNQHKSSEYLSVNPRGKVPALVVDGQLITENTAILTYIGKRFPKTKMLPDEPLAQARCISQMAWFSNTPHISQRGIMRPYRFASDKEHHEDVKATMKSNFWSDLQEIDASIDAKTWVLGDEYTMADPYALVFYRWGVRAELPMSELKSYTRLKDRLLERPAVRTVLAREKDTFLKASA
jgi:glutathione S-transferase